MNPTLREITQNIQRHYGLEVDGKFGPITAEAVWQDISGEVPPARPPTADEVLDARSLANIGTLDPKCQDKFKDFLLLAKATAATLGCDYVCTGGNRTWKEQDALYEQGRSTPGKRVTNARGGQSNHNFEIAADFSVFQGRIWLEADNSDGGTPTRRELAAKVHRACSLHAADCGLEWGGSWKSIVDQPHYEVATGLSMMQKRALYQKEGSVL